MLIYKITNTQNGMAYIGSTCRPVKQRMSNHWSDARRGKDTLIAQAIRDFGRESFTVEVIGEAKSSDEMMVMEIEAIKSHGTCHPSGYNSSTGVGLWLPGRRHLESVREKISLAHKGKKLSQEHRLRLSESLKGKPSWNHGIKTGKPAWNRGIPNSEACRAKMVAYYAANVSPNARPVEANGITYPSVMAAARALGLSKLGMKYRLRVGLASYIEAPEGGYADKSLPERCKTACPTCGGPYSQFRSGARYCKPCRNKKMAEAQRRRRASAKLQLSGAAPDNLPEQGTKEKENNDP